MKGVIIFLAVVLTIALCVAGYAVLETEPDFLYYAGYIASVAPIPLILYVAIKLLYNMTNATAAIALTAREKREKAKSEKEVAKARNAAELERVKAQQAAQLAEQARLAAAAPPPIPAKPAQSDMVPSPSPPSRHISSGYPQMANPILAWTQTKIGRTTLATVPLIMFMILPQFNFMVKFDGFRIISLISENLSDIEILSPMWLGIIAICWMIANPFVAYYAPVHIGFWLNTALAINLVVIFLLFKINLNGNLLNSTSDNEFADIMAKGFVQSELFGFTWGYFLVVVMTTANAILSSKAVQNPDVEKN